MAFGTILEVGNPFFAMLFFNICRIVLMAGIAIIGAQAVRVTHLAIAKSAFTVIEGEDMRAVKERWYPGSRVVTRKAIAVKQPQMISWLRVAGGTLLRRATKNTAGMAIGASYILMRPG